MSLDKRLKYEIPIREPRDGVVVAFVIRMSIGCIGLTADDRFVGPRLSQEGERRGCLFFRLQRGCDHGRKRLLGALLDGVVLGGKVDADPDWRSGKRGADIFS